MIKQTAASWSEDYYGPSSPPGSTAPAQGGSSSVASLPPSTGDSRRSSLATNVSVDSLPISSLNRSESSVSMWSSVSSHHKRRNPFVPYALRNHAGNAKTNHRLTLYQRLLTNSKFISSFKKCKTRPVFTSPDVQTREGVWENSRVCVNPSHRREFTQRLSSSSKVPRVFASAGYVNTASFLYIYFVKYTTKIVLAVFT